VPAVAIIGSCEVDVTPLWTGEGQDLFQREFTLQPSPERRHAYPSGTAGVVRLTLVARRALAVLKATHAL